MLPTWYGLASLLIWNVDTVNLFLLSEKDYLEEKQKDANENHSIEQKLDHFNALDLRIWPQRYLKSDAFYQPGGPTILYVGGETRFTHIHLRSTQLLIRMARELGAMLYYLEHRFYGEVRPTPDSGLNNLKYLSSRQATEDLASFIHNITVDSKGTLNKWILFGSSYAGSLALWTRLKYPHLVYAVVAASPPLEAKLFFSEYMHSVNETLYKYGGNDCHNAIQGANRESTELMKSRKGRKELKKIFNLCEDPGENQNSMNVFHTVMNGHIENIVQFSKGNILFKTPGDVYITIHEMCDIMTNISGGRKIERFAHLVGVRRNSTRCSSTDFEEYIKAMRNETWGEQSGNRAWLYQTCTEFGWFQTAAGDPFQPVPQSFPKLLCKELFAPKLQEDVVTNAPQQTNTEYGGVNVAKVLTRTVIFNGGVDPWHKVSYWKSNVKLNSEKIQVYSFPRTAHFETQTALHEGILAPFGFNSIFIESCSHAEIVRWESEDDSVQLKNARNAVIALLQLWVNAE